MSPEAGPAEPLSPTSAPKNAATKAAELGLRAPSILFEGDESPVPQALGGTPKFAVPPAVPVPQSELQVPTLPESYGTHRLFVAARDPHCLYVHWDFAPEKELVESQASQPNPLRLRIHSGDLTGPTISDLPVSTDTRHSFVHVETAGAQFVAELGYYSHGRDWRALAASQPTMTPPDRVAEEKGVRFATFPLETSLPQAAKPVTAPAADQRPAPVSAPTLEHQQATPNLPIEKPALLAPVVASGAYPLSGPSATPGIPTPSVTGEFSVSPQTSETAPEPILASSDWTAAREAALADVIGWKSIPSECLDSAQLIQLVQGGRTQPNPVQSWEPHQLVAPEGWSAGITSRGAQSAPERPEFWLRVNAELVVYGSSAPGSAVSIGGRPIQLRPDGTFSYRFALPDGQYELPIAAVSARGEVREAKLTFQRATAFVGEVGADAQTPGLRAPDPSTLT